MNENSSIEYLMCENKELRKKVNAIKNVVIGRVTMVVCLDKKWLYTLWEIVKQEISNKGEIMLTVKTFK